MSAVTDALANHTIKPTGDVAAMKHERSILAQKREGLFGFEDDVKKELDKRIAVLDSQINALTSGHGYPRLDPVVLSWRHDRPISWRENIPVPKLAPLPLDSNSVYLGFKSDYGRKSINNLPTAVAGKRYYPDLDAALASVWNSRRSQRLTLTFTYSSGAMPDELRTLVALEKSNFAEIFLLAEAPFESWSFSHTRVKRRDIVRARLSELALDPIVIGYDGHHMWVLGSFDPTPVEQYIVAEFTSKQ